MFKKVCTWILCLALLAALCPQLTVTQAANVVESGTCGDYVTWTLDSSGVLTISGTGKMDEYTFDEPQWVSLATQVKKIVIQYGVTSVGSRTFWHCSNATSVSIPSSVVRIGDCAFGTCAKLTDVTIPSSVTSLGFEAFYGCAGLRSLTIPSSVTEIGYGAFCDCSGLTQVSIPSSLTEISSSLFGNCTSLTTITIPDSITSIGDYAFEGCTSLTSVTIPDSVTRIGDSAFAECFSLAGMTIPASVTYIGCLAFYACPSLTTVTVESSTAFIDSSAFGYTYEGETIAGFTISGYYGSTAEDYANDNGFAFVPLDEGTQPRLYHVPAVSPTCTENGNIEYWTDGSHYYSDANMYNEITLESTVIPAAHSPAAAQLDPDSRVPATCTEAGHYDTVVYCYLCHAELSRETVIEDPLGHNWGDWTVVTPATEETPGLEERTCSRCGETEQWELPVLGSTETLRNFFPTQIYRENFTDVKRTSWYHDSVALAYELGLVKGASDTSYNRRGDIKIGETIALACRIRSIYMADNADFTAAEGEKWYDPYVHYAIVNGIIQAGEYEAYNVSATREQFAAILAHALPESELQAKNTVADGAIPDVAVTDAHAKEIYLLYRAGVLTGNDKVGTFTPENPIKRSEVAAIIVRMAIPGERQTITLE